MAGVADHFVHGMAARGMRAVFGLPGGGGNLDVIDAAGRANVRFVLTSTETGSALAAVGYAEVAGAAGACLTTLGPGAASVVNGVACAYLDRAPLLVVTDAYAGGASAPFPHQRLDHAALFAPVTKWSGRIDPGDAGKAIDRAFWELGTEPPGPVHLDWPGDGAMAVPAPATATKASSSAPVAEPDAERARFDGLLSHARKPLLIVGLGARRAEDAPAIRDLCEACGVPALVTYKGKGVVPDRHDWWAGLFTNGAVERPVIAESDLLIGIGFDPVEILPRPWTHAAPIVSVAPWRMTPDCGVPFAAQHVGPVAPWVRTLRDRSSSTSWDPARVRALVRDAGRALDIRGTGMTAQDVVGVVAGRCATRTRVTVDAGAHMFAATTGWPVDAPHDLLISNGLSTMGFALPAAIGAAVADAARPVVALTGDGGLLICLGELATVVRERLRVITVVFNDASLSLIEIKQRQRRLQASGTDLGGIEWPRIAEGFGMPAWSASSPAELDLAVESALGVAGPSLIEATTDRSNYAATLRAIRG